MYDDEKYKYSAHTHAKLYNCNINKRQYNETIARVMDNYDLNFGIIKVFRTVGMLPQSAQ